MRPNLDNAKMNQRRTRERPQAITAKRTAVIPPGDRLGDLRVQICVPPALRHQVPKPPGFRSESDWQRLYTPVVGLHNIIVGASIANGRTWAYGSRRLSRCRIAGISGSLRFTYRPAAPAMLMLEGTVRRSK